MDFLRTFFYPGSEAPAGGAPTTLQFEGIDTGWAVIILIAVMAVTWFLHRWWLPQVSWPKRMVLIVLRGLFVACLLFAATRPVLITTIVDNVRQKLLVLVDSSESMSIADQRLNSDDLGRLAIAQGKAAPGTDPSTVAGRAENDSPTRGEVLRLISENSDIDLWNRLSEKAELVFYRFGRDSLPTDISSTSNPDASGQDLADTFLDDYDPQEAATALGESLRQVIDRHRGEPVSGVFVISDGASNSGFSAPEAAAQARAENLPLYLYGIGVTQPRDVMISSVDAPRIGFINERVIVRAKLRSSGYEGQEITLSLTKGEDVIDEVKVTLADGMDEEVEFEYTPEETGNLLISVGTPVLDGEASDSNNLAETRIRVVDNRVKVFMIEQQPRWDYRYLLDFLQNDRRLTLQLVLLDGDPSLLTIPNSPFQLELPDNREDLYESDIILIGDVDAQRLGTERMELIREWVDQVGGGLVILAGPNFQPRTYAGTPLEDLLPVVPAQMLQEDYGTIYEEPVKLLPTRAGLSSPLMEIVPNRTENAAIWRNFPGVRWTAPVARVKPGAEVLLIDPTPEKQVSNGPLPVLARQRYGRGEVIYFGFNETYRWRSGVGGEYYATIWGQMLQALALDRLAGASKLVQIKSDQSEYMLGQEVTISGRLYQPDFKPLEADLVPGTYQAEGENTRTINAALRPLPNDPGNYRVSFTPDAPGRYRFITTLDPDAPVEFQVLSPNVEMNDTALNLELLQTMAEVSGGRFFREENLHDLPDLIEEGTDQVTTFKRLELFYSPVLLALLILLATSEWLIRRLSNLK